MRRRSPRRGVADHAASAAAHQSPSATSAVRIDVLRSPRRRKLRFEREKRKSPKDQLLKALGAMLFVFTLIFLVSIAIVLIPVGADRSSPGDSVNANELMTNNAAGADIETMTNAPLIGQSRRFPRYGTEEFAKTCPWLSHNALPTFQHPKQDEELFNCTLLARPSKGSNEGLSTWTAEIAAAKIYAVQSGCDLVLDYGPGVDVGAVFASPPSPSKLNEGKGIVNINNKRPEWEIPDKFVCSKGESCYHVGLRKEKMVQSLARDIERSRTDRIKMAEKELRPMERDKAVDRGMVQERKEILQHHRMLQQDGLLLPSLTMVPHYRFQYNPSRDTDEERHIIASLEETMPGFELGTGMACALASAIDFAPSATDFVPTLHTNILPTLRDESNLVIAIYIRTGNTDQMAKIEKERKEAGPVHTLNQKEMAQTNRLDSNSLTLIKCVMAIEEEQLSSGTYSKSVWLVITDSPSVGSMVKESYGGEAGNTAFNNDDRILQREVITTGAKGIQTRPSRSPGTEDFAEAAIDWMLLGESDVVISSSGYSFADTGALRTARPVFSPNDGGCARRLLMPTGRKSFGEDAFGERFQDSYELK